MGNQSGETLKRTLGITDLVVFGMVFMAPVAAMALFGVIASVSQGHSVLSFVIGFVAMLFTAYSFGKMVEAFPVAGSTYTYVTRSFQPKLGFLAGWGILLDYLFIPILTFLISASFMNELIPSVPIWVWILIFAIPVTVVNILGVNVAAKVNFLFAGSMIIAVIAFVTTSLMYVKTGQLPLVNMTAIFNPDSFTLTGVIGGAAIVTVAYLGFDAITTLAEESKVSGKKIGIALMIVLFIQTVFHLSVTYFGIGILGDYTKITNPDTAFTSILGVVTAGFVQTFITLMISLSGVASALASQAASSRLLFGMGRDNVIPNKFFGYIHPKYKTPVFNILLMSVIGAGGAMIFSMHVISDLVAFGGLFGFMFVNLSVINYYFIQQKQRNVIMHLLIPLVGMLICLYILLGLSKIALIIGAIWLLIGAVYITIQSATAKSKSVAPVLSSHE